MAVSDLMDRLSAKISGEPQDDDDFEVPDDLSGLDTGEADDLLPPDPKPSRKKRTLAPSTGSGKATTAQKRQVNDALLMLLTPTTGLLAMKDPHCGGAAFAQREEIVKAMVPIICRNPAMLRWFTASNAPWLDYLALLTALQPVGAAVWQHHVKKTVGHGDGGGGLDLSAYTA